MYLCQERSHLVQKNGRLKISFMHDFYIESSVSTQYVFMKKYTICHGILYLPSFFSLSQPFFFFFFEVNGFCSFILPHKCIYFFLRKMKNYYMYIKPEKCFI